MLDGSENISQTSLPIRVLTHNIRYATTSPFKGEKPWAERLPLIMNELKYNTRYLDNAFICLQEVLHNQLQDTLQNLNGHETGEEELSLPHGPFWAHVGVAREDGKTKGEYNPILYPIKTFKLLHCEYMWLSPTPDQPSKGWDAGSERMLTTGDFEHKTSGRRVIICNTHLDNAGSEAREKGVKIILKTIERVQSEWSQFAETQSPVYHDGPAVLLAGDFNSFPTQEAYLAMASSGLMVDIYDHVPAKERYGPNDTFTGFQPDTDENKDEIGRIDFIWLGPKDAVNTAASDTERQSRWRVDGYAVLPNVYDDGVFSSDHRCVDGDILLGAE